MKIKWGNLFYQYESSVPFGKCRISECSNSGRMTVAFHTIVLHWQWLSAQNSVIDSVEWSAQTISLLTLIFLWAVGHFNKGWFPQFPAPFEIDTRPWVILHCHDVAIIVVSSIKLHCSIWHNVTQWYLPGETDKSDIDICVNINVSKRVTKCLYLHFNHVWA